MLIHIPYEHVGFLQVTGHIGYLWAGPEPMISRNIGKIMGKYRIKIWQILYIYKWRFIAWKWIKLNGRFSYATLHGRRLEKDRKRTILKGLNHMSIHLFWGGTTRHNMGLHFLKLYETPVPICIKHRPFFWGGDEITHLGPWNGGCFPWDTCCRDSFRVVRRWYNWEAWRTNASTCA